MKFLLLLAICIAVVDCSSDEKIEMGMITDLESTYIEEYFKIEIWDAVSWMNELGK